MTRDELTQKLRLKYKEGLPCGVEKIREPGLENIWFVVPPPPPRQPPGGLPADAIAKANRLIERLPRIDTADELDRIISYLFIRREAVQSSRMEGTWSTIDNVLTPGEVFDRKEGPSERASVRGYAHALDVELASCGKKGYSIFNTELACRLHREIMSKDPHYKGRPGRLRSPGTPGSVVSIGGLGRRENSIYNPAPPRHVARCLEDVIRWMGEPELIELGDAGMGMPLPVRMAIGHSHFEAVHPFSDGNGRVGRMLLTLQMACHGTLPIYLSGYIEERKNDYSEALQQAQKQLKYGPIVEFTCLAIEASHHESKQTKKSLAELRSRWRERGRFREGSAASRALSFLLTNPILTAKQLGDALDVSSPAAYNAVEQLLKATIVRERTGFERNRVFAAEEVIELLSRRFGDDPALALDRAQTLMRP